MLSFYLDSMSDEELLDLCENYEGMYQACVFDDEPEMYATWFEEAKALDSEAKSRGLGEFFEVFSSFGDQLEPYEFDPFELDDLDYPDYDHLEMGCSISPISKDDGLPF